MNYVTCICTVVGGNNALFNADEKKAEGNQLFLTFNMPSNIAADSIPKLVHSHIFDLISPTIKKYWLDEPTSNFPSAIQDAVNLCTAAAMSSIRKGQHIVCATTPIAAGNDEEDLAAHGSSANLNVRLKTEGSVSVLILSKNVVELWESAPKVYPTDIPTPVIEESGEILTAEE